MPPIRVLVVDDSVVIRKVLCDALTTDPAIEIAGIAADGLIALAKIPLLKPDLITLDVEMPGKTGIETLKEIRKLYPHIPVIMFSTLTERGASITLDALSMGASDYVAKPSNTGSLEATRARIQAELLPKVKALCHGLLGLKPQVTPPQPKPPAATKNFSLHTSSSKSDRIDVLTIGTSTGGPNALAVLLPGIAADFPIPIVIVQHMPPLFTRLLAERLNKQSSVSVQEGEEGAILKPGVAWIAPGDHHMTVDRDQNIVKLKLNQGPTENSCRPAVDVLFRSVAKTYGPRTLAVVLTGMGSDGVLGSDHVKAAGGHVLVQDEASSIIWGMPGQVAAAGLADGVYPLDGLAGEIGRRVRNSRLGMESSPGSSQRSRVGSTNRSWTGEEALSVRKDDGQR